jgi:sulfoxide reductase heme-binding subunit YedZ
VELFARGGVFILCLLPFAWLVYGATQGGLGPDPSEVLMHETGEWSLRLLALILLISPLRHWSGWAGAMKLRRMLGLYTFFYACLHLLWQARSDIGEALVYIVIFALLLGWRVRRYRGKQRLSPLQ